MKIKIDGREYDFVLRGTVGLVYMAEHMLGMPFESANRYHMAVLYYACLKTSNEGRDIDSLSLQDFVSSLTNRLLSEMSDYFWNKWEELEGPVHENKEGQEDEMGED